MQLRSGMKTKETLLAKQREYLNRICEQLNISYTELAKRIGVHQSTITRLYSDKVNHALSATTLDKIAIHFNVEPFQYASDQVRLIGKVEAMAKVVLFPLDSSLNIDAPPEAVRENAEAIIVDNNDNWPFYKKGEVLYVINDNKPIDPNLDYLVELENGESFIRMMQPGIFEGSFTLIWHNAPPIANVKIKSARPIKWTKKF